MSRRDLTEKIIAAGPLGWTGPVDTGRRLERWLVTGPTPVARRWWNTQGSGTQLAIIAAAVFALVGMLNLAASLGEKPSIRTGPATAAAPSAGAVLTQEAAPADAGRAWIVTGGWQGSGSTDTQEFVVGEHWRVDWIFSPTQPSGHFQVFIYRADGRLLMSVAANNQRGGTDTSFWMGPGKYFLKVNSTGGDWKLGVQDLR